MPESVPKTPPRHCLTRVSWCPQVVKRVSKDCLDNSFQTAVEQVASNQGDHCFERCRSSVGLSHRNTSSPCWIRCFEQTVLGKESSKPGGELGGMSRDALLAAWARPFDSTIIASGGCPALPILQRSQA